MHLIYLVYGHHSFVWPTFQYSERFHYQDLTPISSAGASVIAFLFSSATGNTDRGFADLMGCENAEHAIQTTLVTAAVEYQVLRPWDPVADWRCPAPPGMIAGRIASP